MMKRIISVLVVMALMVAVAAMPALAVPANTGDQPPGPPSHTAEPPPAQGKSAVVKHCNSEILGGSGVIVETPNGDEPVNNCELPA